MKRFYVIMAVLVFIGLVGTAIIVSLSPDSVPMHFNAAGEPDRMGSKYENLMFPAIAAFIGAAMVFESKRQTRRGRTTNERTFLIGTLCVMTLIIGVGFYTGIRGIVTAGNAGAPVAFDIMAFAGIACGIVLVALGNIMPKAQRNSIFGLRTKWSLANDRVWQRCQRFAGISCVVCGVVLIVLPLVLPAVWDIAAMIAVVVVWGVLATVVSYRIYKDDLAEQAQAQAQAQTDGE